MDKRIVHIAPDEKFIDAARKIYENAFPGMNRFVVLMPAGISEPSYVSTEYEYNYISIESGFVDKVNNLAHKAKVVVFHGMNSAQAEIAVQLSESLMKVWSVFGLEVYNNISIKGFDIYGPLTRKKYLRRTAAIKDRLRPMYYRIAKGKRHPDYLVSEALGKMNFIASIYPENIEYFKKIKLVKHGAKWIKFTYYPLDFIVGKEEPFIKGKDILVGNSAFPSGNHIEVFKLLKQLELNDKNILCPLSYGEDNYRDFVLKKGEELFSSRFKPILDFKPLKEYQEHIKGCGIVIMNSYRPQAIGTIVDLMHRGAKVFLSEKNFFYHFLRRIGCHVFSIERDLKDADSLELLDINKMRENRRILEKELEPERLYEELQSKLLTILK